MKFASLMAVGLVALASTAAAQVTPVYGSGATFTNSGSNNLSDASCALQLDTWCAANVRSDGVVGITGTNPRNGNGSLEFSGPAGKSYKADFQYLLSTPFALSTLTSMSYDWFRDAASSNPATQAPALRLLVSSGAGWGGYLIYEPAYNGVPSAPEGSWQTAAIGAGTNLWLVGAPGGILEEFSIPLSTWQSPTGYSVFNHVWNGDLSVVGFEVGVGSGWAGEFLGMVDNVSYQTSAMNEARTFNFEVARTTVPEPTSVVLLGVGMFGLAMTVRRRRV